MEDDQKWSESTTYSVAASGMNLEWGSVPLEADPVVLTGAPGTTYGLPQSVAKATLSLAARPGIVAVFRDSIIHTTRKFRALPERGPHCRPDMLARPDRTADRRRLAGRRNPGACMAVEFD